MQYLLTEKISEIFAVSAKIQVDMMHIVASLGTDTGYASLAGMSQKIQSPHKPCCMAQHTFPTYCLNHDVDFDQLTKIVSAVLLHCNITLFPFVIKKYFVGSYFKSLEDRRRRGQQRMRLGGWMASLTQWT